MLYSFRLKTTVLLTGAPKPVPKILEYESKLAITASGIFMAAKWK